MGKSLPGMGQAEAKARRPSKLGSSEAYILVSFRQRTKKRFIDFQSTVDDTSVVDFG